MTVPRDCFPYTTWCELLGVTVLADHARCQHQLLYILAGTDGSRPAPRDDFLRLAQEAAAFSFRLRPGMAATGVGNASELDWLNTLYAYLKGTQYVIEGPGYSRMPSLFAASTAVLSLLRRADAGEPVSSYPESLRPGIPGEAGVFGFERVRPMTEEEYQEAVTPPAPPEEVREWLANRYRSVPPAELENGPNGERMAFDLVAAFTEYLNAARHPALEVIAACERAGWVRVVQATVREPANSQMPTSVRRLNLSIGHHELLAILSTVLSASANTDFGILRALIQTLRLKGNEAETVMAICDGNGTVRIADLAVRFGWGNSTDNWNSTRKRLNDKFKPHRWRFTTLDNNATVEHLPVGGRKY